MSQNPQFFTHFSFSFHVSRHMFSAGKKRQCADSHQISYIKMYNTRNMYSRNILIELLHLRDKRLYDILTDQHFDHLKLHTTQSSKIYTTN